MSWLLDLLYRYRCLQVTSVSDVGFVEMSHVLNLLI
jgi:hypothetical protein